MNNWIALIFSGVLEVVWSVGLKKSAGFSHLPWTAVTLVTAVFSFFLLASAMKALPLGTAYAVFTGIGAVGAFCFGILVLGEPVGILRVASALLIVAGVIGLKVATTA
ncbi:DMT family transporter [Paraburkholderia hospita]|jgi:quaternary ammonium compound-resistance protein SugE|uniref:DMT family transporter n=1 Tax=Paraburkholderia hospita TaxID=169430 RepID=UPI0002719357|nr:multidrug efflux SMR transporter [Paraburkholderia hospita]EUC20678.1 small multidrug resistance protein [Burkholderia sp. BT03]SKC45234.1 Multidrug transporter EmrE [Paraburkholderia hospita]SKD04363.1 Multidrug transporter EmrE [Paraburkholderia hospita]